MSVVIVDLAGNGRQRGRFPVAKGGEHQSVQIGQLLPFGVDFVIVGVALRNERGALAIGIDVLPAVDAGRVRVGPLVGPAPLGLDPAIHSGVRDLALDKRLVAIAGHKLHAIVRRDDDVRCYGALVHALSLLAAAGFKEDRILILLSILVGAATGIGAYLSETFQRIIEFIHADKYIAKVRVDKKKYLELIDEGWPTLEEYGYQREDTRIHIMSDGSSGESYSTITETLSIRGTRMVSKYREHALYALENGKPVITQISGHTLLGDTMREPGE